LEPREPQDRIDPMIGRGAGEWDRLVSGLPPVSVPWPPVGPIVVVAPHPDDELLAAGATLAAASDAGTEITVVAVTDGEASHPHLTGGERDELVGLRLAETDRAYAVAGIVAVRHRLGLPDGGASDHEGHLAERLVALLAGAAWCLAPWESDGHPDHDVSGRVAGDTCRDLGVRFARFPVWSWNWDDPSSPSIPFDRAVAWSFGNDMAARKQAGIAAYSSQVQPADGHRPVLPAGFLEHFARCSEVFLPVAD
jgi:LmbE family N-acetylglucosaminyl deacetylase